MSPTDFELLATCPFEFFLRRILDIRRPDRYRPVPGKWLEGNIRGTLVHDLFQNFLMRLEDGGKSIDAANRSECAKTLEKMLGADLEKYRKLFPPPDPLAHERETSEIREACDIFLDAEEKRQRRGRPVYFEAALGGASGQAPWGDAPIVLSLPNGRELRLKGRVDRIDRLDGHGGLSILDYKTGWSGKYSPLDPFRQGRHLQPLLYVAMLEQAVGGVEPVKGFSYFFPMPRDEGRTIAYTKQELSSGGMDIVLLLSELLASGAFVFTTDEGDVEYSDYAPVYGDAKRLAGAARRKVMNFANQQLAVWAELRGMTND